jgi:hypothetical protein
LLRDAYRKCDELKERLKQNEASDSTIHGGGSGMSPWFKLFGELIFSSGRLFRSSQCGRSNDGLWRWEERR